MRPPVRSASLATLLPLMFLVGCSGDAEVVDPTASETPGSETPGTVAPDAGSELPGVIADVERLAPALESAVRGTAYPETVGEAEAALEDAGLALSPGNVVGGYAYDAADVEFALCIESASGSWALYDTAPMSTRSSGESGGCPG